MVRLWETKFAESSLTGTSDYALTRWGSKSRASPRVRLGGRKLGCRTSMYNNKGLSTKRLVQRATKWSRLDYNRV